ncbi:hypothetical protein ACT80S_18610 [Ramlibacter sp. MAHUQ-53]|uniref:hypothetical protein n=1 Tax=unclassified Ramlibacter TaxID=2617605 RepID=UPI00362FEC5A
MPFFQFASQASGASLGIYEGSTAQDAYRAMLEDAGEPTDTQADADLVTTEVTRLADASDRQDLKARLLALLGSSADAQDADHAYRTLDGFGLVQEVQDRYVAFLPAGKNLADFVG